ncbi:uncharacterized protein VTP21DRAFT_3705 [Calcarisporiella thermophila]|uniref:uncharacterized protein n=1 Tax=Calcarisporiella thermophila TaxID=911321 RepID=UPI003742CBE9
MTQIALSHLHVNGGPKDYADDHANSYPQAHTGNHNNFLSRSVQSKFPLFKNLVVYSGNLLLTGATRSNISLKKSNAELIKSLHDTFVASLGAGKQPSFNYDEKLSLLEVPDIRRMKLYDEDREDLDITVKFFYLPNSNKNATHFPPPEYIGEALDHLEKLLGTKAIDTFILSFSGKSFSKDSTEDKIHEQIAAWRELEKVHDRIGKLGVSEFSLNNLKTFVEAATIPPAVNQINLNDCCSAPKDLIRFARERDIELLSHSDHNDILPTHTLNTILTEHGISSEETLVPRWVVRYSIMIRCRGIIADRGYIVKATAEN